MSDEAKVVALTPTKQKTEEVSRINMRSYKRQQLRDFGNLVQKADEVMFSRQVEENDPFDTLYAEERLLKPVYDFTRLYTVFEESDILQTCVDAMKWNVDGFGYKLQFLGDDKTDKDKPESEAQRVKAENFFDQVNGEESFATIRKKSREDYEVLGNGAFEFVRNRIGDLQMIYHAPFNRIRISALSGRSVNVPVQIMRNGKEVTVTVRRYFRKFCQVDEFARRLRWFKALGDPREMDYRTGIYGPVSPQFRATELWHIRNEFAGNTYGMPRWIGAIFQVLGRRSASYVNYDLFQNQGIPPFLILVSGGVLSDDSIDEVESILRGMRGLENFNRAGILESTIEGLGIDEKGSARIEVKNMAEYRKEDQLFDRYLTTAKADIRHRYRLPDLYVGQSETYTHATAKAAQTVAEEQVFIPERGDFDEKVNLLLMRKELGITLWRYQSKGPRIVGSQELSAGVSTFSSVGAFTINHAIDVANDALGLEMSKFTELWADYPVAMVLELVKTGNLKGIDPIALATAEQNAAQLPGPAKPKLLPAMTAKMFKSDMFAPDEQSLYKFLVNFQAMMDSDVVGSGCDYEDTQAGEAST